MKTIVKAAIEVRKNAHAPYSNYTVGAAVETDDGTIVTGCNVESSSYGSVSYTHLTLPTKA